VIFSAAVYDIKCVVSYFRQLQEISDSVVDAKWEGSLDDEIEKISAEDKTLTEKINAGVARQRYLNNLTKEKEKGVQDEDEGICILCRCEVSFLLGFVTIRNSFTFRFWSVILHPAAIFSAR
jgi:E3 ubiquitin-protein ligase SHPRH